MTGFGLDAVHDFAVFRLPGQFLRYKSLASDPGRALREGIEGMCKDLFGVHEGEGLP